MMRNMMLMPTQESVYSLALCDFVIFSAGITHVSQKYGWLWNLKLQSIQHYPGTILQSGVWNDNSGTRHTQSPFKLMVDRCRSCKRTLKPTFASSTPFQSDQLYIPSYMWIFNPRKFIRFVLIYRYLTTLISCMLALSCYLYIRKKKTWIKTVTLVYSLCP